MHWIMLLLLLAVKPVPSPHPSVAASIMRYPQLPVETFDGSKLSAHRIELICFGAAWCSPCQALKPMILRMQGEGLPVYYNDIGQFPQMARAYEVTAVPHWTLRVDGEQVERHVGGGINECAIRSWIDRAERVSSGEGKWLPVTKQKGCQQLVPLDPAGVSRVRGRGGSYYWVQSN